MARTNSSVFDPQRFAEVLARAKRGDELAFRVLYEAYHPRMLRYLRARAGDSGEDLASEVWITIARGLKRFTGDEAGFRGWIFTSARHRLIDHARRRQVRPVEAQEELPEMAVTDPARLESEEAVRELVAGLNDEQAEIVLLRVLGGFSAREVATMLDTTEEAVRVAQHRALRRLAGGQPSAKLSHRDEHLR